jgi:hypothetical protein
LAKYYEIVHLLLMLTVGLPLAHACCPADVRVVTNLISLSIISAVVRATDEYSISSCSSRSFNCNNFRIVASLKALYESFYVDKI